MWLRNCDTLNQLLAPSLGFEPRTHWLTANCANLYANWANISCGKVADVCSAFCYGFHYGQVAVILTLTYCSHSASTYLSANTRKEIYIRIFMSRTQCSRGVSATGGPSRIRIDNLVLARDAIYQLIYKPIRWTRLLCHMYIVSISLALRWTKQASPKFIFITHLNWCWQFHILL